MIFDVICQCGMVHRLEIGDSALCQCGRTISVRQDGSGWITPWGGKISWDETWHGDFETKQIYKKQPIGE